MTRSRFLIAGKLYVRNVLWDAGDLYVRNVFWELCRGVGDLHARQWNALYQQSLNVYSIKTQKPFYSQPNYSSWCVCVCVCVRMPRAIFK